MPADQLNPGPATRVQHAPTATVTPTDTAEGVLAVLSGSPLDQVAAGLGMHTADLADAVETYQQAGHAALVTQATTHDWYQVHVPFPEWATAENTAVAGLGPQLQHLQDTGVIAAQWFIRKAPCWRLRMKPGDNASCAEMQTSVNSILDGLTSAGLISRWRQTLYEPETVAFGGRPGIDIAHDLFCSDTSNFLAYLRQPEPPIGRRELSVLFGAHGPLTFAAPWAAAFNHAGQALAAATEGALERGTRDTLAHHVIFHWNRMGLPSDV